MEPAAAFALPHLSGVRVTGPDARAYLHSQLTHDVAAQPLRQWQVSAWCDAKGRCLLVLLVALVDEPEAAVELIAPTEQMPLLLKRLQMYAIGRQVHIGAMQAVSGGALGWPMTQDPSRHLQLLATHDNAPVADAEQIQAWRQRDLQLPLPWLSEHSSGAHLPQALALDDHLAVSTTKGCYPGQEVIARLHYLGRNKRQLLTIDDVAETPQPATAVLDDNGEPIADWLDAAPPFGLAVSRRLLDGPTSATVAGCPVTLKPFPAKI